MKALLLLLLLIMQPLQADELPRFAWDETAARKGLDIQGKLAWDQAACDFDKVEQETRPFPVFAYKGPSGKPHKDPTGAFCFLVELPAESIGELLHFSMIRVFGLADIRINGEKVYAQDPGSGLKRPSFLYEVKDPRLQVEIRMRCTDNPSCGFRGALHIREQRQGVRADLLHYSHDLLAIFGILACLFYHLIFAFLRRRSSTAIFLSINAVALILRLFLTGHGQLHFFSGLPENWYWRLETFAAYLLLASTVSLVKTVFDKEAPPHAALLGWSIAGTASVFLFLDSRVFPFLLLIVYLLVLINIINYTIVIRRALRNRRTGAVIMVVCATVTFFSVLFEALNSRLNIEMHATAQPFSYLATMIFQSVLLATRINDAFVLAEKQESEIKTLKEKIEVEIRSLDQKILERTTELRTIFQSISTGILWISRSETNELLISTEYSDHLRKTIGFDVEAWHQLHFFLRRLRLADMPQSGKDMEAWFRQLMDRPDLLDHKLEGLLGGVKVFDDLDLTRHLKFKWIPIIDSEKVSELFLFVFDVSKSMDIQELANYKVIEIAALRELTRLPAPTLIAFYKLWPQPASQDILDFALQNGLPELERALNVVTQDKHLERFMHAYGGVLSVLAERLEETRQQTPFDLKAFLHMADWEQLPVDTRRLFHELVRAQDT